VIGFDDAAPWLRVALWIGGVYLLLCALLWAVQDKLIFHPRSVDAAPSHPAVTPVAIQRPDAVLRGWLVNGNAAGPLVLYFGGNAEEVSENIRPWLDRDATTLLVNYRGYGDSDGKPSAEALVADAVAIVAWLRERGGRRPLVLLGHSLGAGVAALAAPRVEPQAMILVSPYRSLAHIARKRYPIFPVRWLLRHPFAAESAAAALPRTLVFASPGDRVVPFEESLALARAIGANAQLHTAQVAHGGFFGLPQFWDAVDALLADLGDGAALD